MKIFNIYGHGGHLGSSNQHLINKFSFPCTSKLQSSRKPPVCRTNPQNSEMSGEFCQFAGQYVRKKINPEKCPDSVFGLLDLQLMQIAHISCIFCIKFAVFTEYGKTSIQTKQNPVIFVQQFSLLSEKIFQSAGQLSGNISEDSTKTEAYIQNLVKNDPVVYEKSIHVF